MLSTWEAEQDAKPGNKIPSQITRGRPMSEAALSTTGKPDNAGGPLEDPRRLGYPRRPEAVGQRPASPPLLQSSVRYSTYDFSTFLSSFTAILSIYTYNSSSSSTFTCRTFPFNYSHYVPGFLGSRTSNVQKTLEPSSGHLELLMFLMTAPACATNGRPDDAGGPGQDPRTPCATAYRRGAYSRYPGGPAKREAR